MSPLDTVSDAELVQACMKGERDAFARIVERYQRLLCSLAYASTGSVSESEDVAQEAFLTAWRHLRTLREPEKLRPWLCGILRHQVGRLRRRDGREPVRRADPLEDAGDLVAPEARTEDQTMHHEEQALLWRALENVPQRYREPLVLYYREHRSVEHVADALDLTEDAVKQRLARGRRMIQEQVLALVEGALARTTPGRAFTVAVLAALPAALPMPVKAAGLGTAVAHGGFLAKSSSLVVLLASTTGVLNFVLSLRGALDQARTDRERREVTTAVTLSFALSLGFLGLIWGLRVGALHWGEHRRWFAVAAQSLVLAAVVVWPFLIRRMLRRFRHLRSAERLRQPDRFAHPADHVASPTGEYRSRATLFGVPLVHIRFAMPDEGARPLFAWIAAGDRAYGLLFAWGTWAMAPISAGVVSVGVLSVGALGVGLVGIGTIGIGVIGLGCLAIGVHASAWLSAVGWTSAQSNGFALARVVARGPVAEAAHANDALAQQAFANPHAELHQMLFFAVIALLSLVPLIYYTREVRRRFRPTPPRS